MPPDGHCFESMIHFQGSSITAMPAVTKIAAGNVSQIKFVGAPSKHGSNPPAVKSQRISQQSSVTVPSNNQNKSKSTTPSPRTKPFDEEVMIAVKWWTQNMRQHDLSQQELNLFELSLKGLIELRCEGHWYPAEPRRGSGHRSIVNDISIDPILLAAAGAARIRDIASRLPSAILWINPGSVRVQIEGERCPLDLYADNNPRRSGAEQPVKLHDAVTSGSDEDH